MDVTTIEVPKEQARKALQEYRAALKDDIAKRRGALRAEDEAIAAGYRELARGRNLLDLQQAMKAGGLDEANLPRLAIARADARWCILGWDKRFNPESGKWEWVERFTFGSDERPSWIRTMDRRFSWLDVPEKTPPPVGQDEWNQGLRSQVPVVPPALRPRGNLSRYHVLWEVEEWERVPNPPRDPLLLKRVRGDLFAIVAEWDLTDLERAVMGTRR